MARDTIEFRNHYRKTEIGKHYSGIGHFLFTSISCLTVIIVCILFTHNIRPLEWLVIPFSFLFGNFAEYFGHKGPMHHKRKYLEKVFARHTLQHHRFFSNEVMQCDNNKDFKMILFPPVLFIFFFAMFALPVGLLLFWVWSKNAALLFVATVIGYFLNYEWFHLSYHLPEEHWISKLPILRTLRRLHLNHHHPQLMQKFNFNISYPIFDWIMGTYYRNKKL